jgi:hypothetical protein
MPTGDALRSMPRLHDIVDVREGDPQASLREIVARNSAVNPGSEPFVECAPDAAERVDAFLRRSELLREVDRALSGAGGGFAADRQLWTGSATIVRADPPSAPRADRFQPVRNNSARPAGGLWTSTALTGAITAWSHWREVGSESSSFLGAATAWRLTPRPGVVVREVTGAADWLALVSSYPRTTPRGVGPDWPAIAEAHDAVHFTMTAAVALQGTSYRLADGTQTVPVFVDVESTIWVRWSFTAVNPVPG